MDILSITKTLHTRINASSSEEEVFLLSKIIDKLNVGAVKTVATYIDLLTHITPQGDVWFVEDEERLYYKNGTTWLPITKYGKYPWAWGLNTSGQLGDNTTVSKLSPVSIVGGFTDWVQISAGTATTVAVKENGTAWGWGANPDGRLGDNTTTAKSSPVSVVGGFMDWVQISIRTSHTVGLRANGTVWAWGLNSAGQLGDNTAVSKSSPVSVVGGFTNWSQISAGTGHTAAIRANGTAWAWGGGGNGTLGNNNTANTSSPVSVVGGFTNWSQISAGNGHTAAVRLNGTLWAWGLNSSGQIGNNSTLNTSSPVSVVGGFTDWAQVSAGNFFTVAVRSNGTAWAWGNGYNGRLGDNTATAKSSPVSVVGGFTDWVQVSAGYTHAVAIRTNGTAWAWGNNGSGRLGDGTLVERSSPVSVVGGFTDWIQAATGDQHTTSLRPISL